MSSYKKRLSLEMPAKLPIIVETEFAMLKPGPKFRANAIEEVGDGTIRMDVGHGRYAIFDACDYPDLKGLRWYGGVNGRTHYAYSSRPVFQSMHRVIMSLHPGDVGVVDHINHDGLDNRRCNLRIGTATSNSQNRQKCNVDTLSKYIGVWFYGRLKKWRAFLKGTDKTINLGHFNSEE